MVSFTKILAVAATVGVAVGQLQSIALAQISSKIVQGFNSNVNAGVNAAQASSEANYIVNAIVSDPDLYPFWTTLVLKIITGFNGADFNSIATQGLVKYTSFRSGAKFAPLTSYFKSHVGDFNPNGALLSASSLNSASISLLTSRYKAASTSAGVSANSVALTNVARDLFTSLGLHGKVTVISGW